jgi:hypothetical protein
MFRVSGQKVVVINRQPSFFGPTAEVCRQKIGSDVRGFCAAPGIKPLIETITDFRSEPSRS